MKKTIKSVTCVLLCLIMTMSGCTFSDNNSQNLSSENLSSKKLSQKLSDGSWIDDSWSSEVMVGEGTDGLGFVFKPIDEESGIAVSLDGREFPYHVKDDLIQMFYYNSEYKKYDHMFNAYFTEEYYESEKCEVLVLSATDEGCRYIDEYGAEEVPSLWLYHIEDTDGTNFLNKLYFDCWSTEDIADKTLYTNGFAPDRSLYDLMLIASSQNKEWNLLEFYHTAFEFDIEVDEHNARILRCEQENEKIYYAYMDYGLSDELDGLKITYAEDSKYSGHYTEGEYVYDKDLDALVKKDDSSVVFYRVTRFADTDKVQQLSEEKMKLLQPMVSQAAADYADWKKVYKEYLEPFLEYDSYSNATFSVGYVDNDDIPELFVSLGEDYISQVEVFTICNGILRKLDKVGIYGYISYVEREGFIVVEDSRQGVSTCEVFEMGDGHIGSLWSGMVDKENPAGHIIYYSGGEEVSKSEYEEWFNEYHPEDKLKTSRLENGERGYALTAENLDMFFAGQN